MAKTRVKLNGRGVAEVLKSSEVRNMLTEKADKVLDEARSIAPVVTGNYRDSLTLVEDTTDRARVRVTATAPHAHLVEAQSGTLARALDAAR